MAPDGRVLVLWAAAPSTLIPADLRIATASPASSWSAPQAVPELGRDVFERMATHSVRGLVRRRRCGTHGALRTAGPHPSPRQQGVLLPRARQGPCRRGGYVLARSRPRQGKPHPRGPRPRCPVVDGPGQLSDASRGQPRQRDRGVDNAETQDAFVCWAMLGTPDGRRTERT
jgi:hypothetical protein